MPKVLIVDDSAVDRRLAGALLEKYGPCQVETAENGAAALARMRQSCPDLVLTDLQMPEMDGLELVMAVRLHHPGVPVVLMTAYGSEELAVEALEQGAASYVSKAQLAEKLSDTVDRVLGLVRADRSYERLMSCLDEAQFSFSLENDPSLIDPLVDLVQQIVANIHLCDTTGRVRIGVALEEALLNALYRGNLEISYDQSRQASEDLLQGKSSSLLEQRRLVPPYCNRRIQVHVGINRNEARFVIRDEGPGFNVRELSQTGDLGPLMGSGGRGLVLMRTFMDDVRFNEAGNEVTMLKRRDCTAGQAEKVGGV